MAWRVGTEGEKQRPMSIACADTRLLVFEGFFRVLAPLRLGCDVPRTWACQRNPPRNPTASISARIADARYAQPTASRQLVVADLARSPCRLRTRQAGLDEILRNIVNKWAQVQRLQASRAGSTTPVWRTPGLLTP
jgi:hypothetical protein